MWICVLALAVFFGLEILTPDDVVATFTLLPLLGGAWLFSTRYVVILAAAVVIFFSLALLLDASNRVSLVTIAFSEGVVAFVTRLYATSMAALLGDRLHGRGSGGGTPARGTHPRVLAAFARFRYGLDSLTPRELDVARLAAQGYTAIEIGRELHIGERTVESHLAHTYAKLSISSKSQLIRMSQEFVSNMDHISRR